MPFWPMIVSSPPSPRTTRLSTRGGVEQRASPGANVGDVAAVAGDADLVVAGGAAVVDGVRAVAAVDVDRVVPDDADVAVEIVSSPPSVCRDEVVERARRR